MGNTAITSANLEEILANFNDIDKDGDGRVTNAEIAAYGMDEEIEEMKEEHPEFRATDISNFVDNDDTSST